MIGGLQITTIGSTVDPQNGDQNPYGLAISPVTAGLLHAGDLIIGNFNDSANVQGNGTTLEALSPVAGATPVRLAQDPSLKGVAAIALGPTGNPWVASYVANLNPIFSTSGKLLTTLGQQAWNGPWGQAFSGTAGPFGDAAFFESNAVDGSIVRIDIHKGAPFTFETIATGFGVNGGQPGSILAPAGLTYDAPSDTLFIVDSNQNRLVSLAAVSQLPANSVIADADGTFSGPYGWWATVIYSGAPLNSPISATELFNGDLVVGNTADNQLVEISQAGALVATQNLDTGTAGALFGIAASGTSPADTRIYFNDDNDNTVKVLSN